MQVVASIAMEPPAANDAVALKTAALTVLRAVEDRPTLRTTSAASTRATATIDGVAADSTDRDLRRAAPRDRRLALVGRPLLHPHRQAAAGQGHRGAPHLQGAARRCGASPAPGERRPEPDQLVIRIDPGAAIRLRLEARRADAPGPEPITLDMEFAEEGGEGASPYEVLLAAAMAGDSMRFARQEGVEQQWRIMQPLLDAPPPVHALRAGLGRAGRRRRPGRGPRRLARALDAVMTALDAPRTAARPTETP